MSFVDELYQETILDHYQNPRNKGELEDPDFVGHGVNPLCGDEVELFVCLENPETIKQIGFCGHGCSISQASASMMSEALAGKSLEEINEHIIAFKKMMLANGECLSERGEEFEDIEALEGVKKYPVRIKCAILAWNTLQDALKQAQKV